MALQKLQRRIDDCEYRIIATKYFQRSVVYLELLFEFGTSEPDLSVRKTNPKGVDKIGTLQIVFDVAADSFQ